MFTKEDLGYYKGLMKILDEGTFPLKKREVHSFAQVISWVQGLEARIEDGMKSKPKELPAGVEKKKRAKKGSK